MKILIAGLVLFFAMHVVPWFPSARESLIARLGARRYRGLFSLVSGIGLVLIVLGMIRADTVPVYAPASWAHLLALPLVLAAFVLLPAANMPSNIKRFTAHPMLWGVTLWATAHLLANGDQASLLLFGSFLGYSLADMISANVRGARPSTVRYPLSNDARVLAAGIVAYVIVLALHPWLFGASVF